MKNIKIFKILFFTMLLAVVSSCEKWIDPEINISSNSPGDVTMNVLLSSTQAAVAYTYAGELTRYPCIWMQHLSGVTRQSFATERYSILNSDINNLWNTLYGGALMNLKVLENKAIDVDAKHYLGVSKVMQAFALTNITSVWGDIPYSEALKATEGITKAKYDSQQQIYTTINSLLDDAIALFGQANPAGIAKPATDDIIYKGNIGKWTKLAYSLKVRAALHLSKINGYAPVRDAFIAGTLLESSADDFQFAFGEAANEWNARFQFDDDRGDVRVGKKIVDLMNSTDDPRRNAYFESVLDANKNKVFIGSGPGEGNDTVSFIGSAYASQSSPVFFMTYFELKFIEAEAFVDVDKDRAADAYNAAVKASLAKHSVSNDAWESVNAKEVAGSITMEKIMTAKYIAMFHSVETWADWRRTGIPQLDIPAGNALDAAPRRFLYPLDEVLYNTANVPEHDRTSRVWWDVN